MTGFDDENKGEHGEEDLKCGTGDRGKIKICLEELAKVHGPRVHEDDFDVEEDEDHGDNVKFNGKAGCGASDGIFAAFVGFVFGLAGAGSFAEEEGKDDAAEGNRKGGGDLDEDGKVLAHGA